MDKRINILFTIPNFKTAGSQYVFLAIYKRLDKEIFKPLVLVEKEDGYKPAEINISDFHCISNKLSNLNYIKSLYLLLRKHKIAILHSWDYKSNSLEAIACRLSGTKYLYTKKNNSWSKRWFLKSFLTSHIAYDNPEMFIRFFNNVFLKNKVSFIPHGIDNKLFTPNFESKKPDFNSFNIGCIGNLNSNKNQLFILKAIVQLPEHVKVFFYGNEDTNYRLELNEFIETYQLNNRIFFKGFIDNKDIPSIIQQFDLFVLASFNEGLPLCILEAMACGVPVLSSDSGGGAKYIIKESQGGFIFNLENEHQLVEQISVLLNKESKTYTKLVENGIKHVNKHFTIEKEILSYTALYKDLVK